MTIGINSYKAQLTLTNEGLDNDNYIELKFKKDEDGEVMLPIDELLSAVQAFEDLRIIRLQKDALLKD